MGDGFFIIKKPFPVPPTTFLSSKNGFPRGKRKFYHKKMLSRSADDFFIIKKPSPEPFANFLFYENGLPIGGRKFYDKKMVSRSADDFFIIKKSSAEPIVTFFFRKFGGGDPIPSQEGFGYVGTKSPLIAKKAQPRVETLTACTRSSPDANLGAPCQSQNRTAGCVYYLSAP